MAAESAADSAAHIAQALAAEPVGSQGIECWAAAAAARRFDCTAPGDVKQPDKAARLVHTQGERRWPQQGPVPDTELAAAPEVQHGDLDTETLIKMLTKEGRIQHPTYK